MKFSSAQIKFLVDNGTSKGGKLTIELAKLQEAGPSRSRSTTGEKFAKFSALVQGKEADATGAIRITPAELVGAGLPTSFVTNAPLWAGISEGATMAHELGFKAQYSNTFDTTLLVPVIQVVLRPLTEDDRAKFAKLQARAAAKEAVAAKEAGAGEGAAEGEGEPVEAMEEGQDDSAVASA